jgi:hypothetical protein
MRATQIAVGILGFIALAAWVVFMFSGAVVTTQPATAWAPAVVNAPTSPPVPGMSRLAFAEQETKTGWIEFIEATHVDVAGCDVSLGDRAVAERAVAGACYRGKATAVELERLDHRNEFLRCITEVRVKVACEG